MTYTEAKMKRDELEATLSTNAAALKSFPRGPMNLTPDAIKATPEWKASKRAVDIAFSNLRCFNEQFTKIFKAEIKADRKF